MLETWEEKAYRKQPECNPQDYCSECGEYFGKDHLEEWKDNLVCRECLEIVLEKEE